MSLKNASGWMTLLLVILAFSANLNSTKLPDSSDILLDLAREPVQSKVPPQAFATEVNGFRYEINPLFSYDLHGLVVSKHHSDSIFDYHHKRWNDYLNIADFCVVWGDNTIENVHKHMAFKNTTWTCYYRANDQKGAAGFNGLQLSNNHLLTDDDYIAEQIKSVEVGDQIRLTGYLAQYRQGDFNRGTSVVRDDTGNGACETIYVDDIDILREANQGWRTIYTLSKSGAFVCLLYFLFGGSPYRYRTTR